ncbi:MAG: SDR family oxidoreductase [Sphingomonadaceae bacterium]|nr:SDR family oxidoreductase [Sphingomonadaceae bacterium]
MTCYLVTGAAGLIGGEIAAALADQGASVIGFVRRNRKLRRSAGEIVETEDWTGSTPQPGHIALVTGDVSDPGLGLDRAAYRALAGQVDAIIHCAAIVEFDARQDVYDAINIAGTAHMLEFARFDRGRPIPFVQVSTAYVCGQRGGELAEDNDEAPESFANPYEASKYAAEQLVRAAMAEGLPAVIARPSIVVGYEDDGAIAGFDSIYAAFKLLAEGRIGTIPAASDATLNFVPIDHVVKGIVTMAGQVEAMAGRAFHLVASEPMPVADFFELIHGYPQFADPRLVGPDHYDPESLSPLERRLHRKVATLYGAYFRNNPLFLQDNTEKLLGLAGPVADLALMRRQADFAIRAGFLRAESVAA